MEFKKFLTEWFMGIYDRVTLLEKLWGRDYGHPQRSFYSTELLDKLEATIIRDQKYGRPCFLSVNYYTGEPGKPGEPVALEKIFFDLDSPENIEKARRDARKLVDHLSSYCKPLIVFSGGKGYHIYCYLEKPVEGSREHLKNVLEALYDVLGIHGISLPTLDERVLGDVSRLSRIPYTLHNKTRRKAIPLDHDFKPIPLESFSLAEYASKALGQKHISEALSQALILEELKPKHTRHKAKQHRITWLKIFEDKKILQEILGEGRTYGEEPEEIAKQLVLYFRNIEMRNRDECLKIMIDWCKRTRLLGEDKVIEIVSKYC